MKRLFLLNFMDLIALLAGIATVFAFAPFAYYWLALLTPALLLMTWLNVSAKRALWRGFLFGLGLFGVGTSWLYVSVHYFGNLNILVAGLITVLFIFTLALFPALQGYFVNKLWPTTNPYKLLLVFPASWVLFEWLRELFLTGFPWLFLGVSQINGPLAGFAPLVGTFGTSFLVVFCAGLLTCFITYPNWRRYFAILGILILLGAGLLLYRIDWTHPKGAPITVSLVQGNIAQELKWNSDWVIANIERYQQLTKHHWHSQLILWPENAIPIPLPDASDITTELNAQALAHHSTLMTGIPILVDPDRSTYYNSLIALGTSQGEYDKRHLVPFGEYIPLINTFQNLLNFLRLPMSSFISGPQHQSLLLINHKIPVATFICYEIAYSRLIDQDLPQAQLLITISDDAWFGHSFAAWQHLQIGQMQALSTGRELLFSTNNGMTAIVNSHGKIIKIAPAFKPFVLTGQIQPTIGTTPWVFFDNWPIICLMFILLVIAFLRRKQ